MTLEKIIDKGEYLFESNSSLYFLQWVNGKKENFFCYKDTLKQIEEVEFLNAITHNWEKIQNHLKFPLHDYCFAQAPNGEMFFQNYQNGILRNFDKNGNFKSSTNLDELVNCGHAIYSIQFEAPNFLWLAFPTGQTVSKLDLSTNQEVFKIGEYTFDDVFEPLNYPETIFINGKNLYISNMGNSTVNHLDLNNYNLTIKHRDFPSKVWEFTQVNNDSYVRLANGIFKIKNVR